MPTEKILCFAATQWWRAGGALHVCRTFSASWITHFFWDCKEVYKRQFGITCGVCELPISSCTSNLRACSASGVLACNAYFEKQVRKLQRSCFPAKVHHKSCHTGHYWLLYFTEKNGRMVAWWRADAARYWRRAAGVLLLCCSEDVLFSAGAHFSWSKQCPLFYSPMTAARPTVLLCLRQNLDQVLLENLLL